MVADGLWNGGAERQMALLASSLPEGWSPTIASLRDGPYRPVLEGLGIDVRVVPRRFRFDITPALRLWGIASKIAPDVVHSWGWMSTLAMLPYCRLRGVPLVSGSIRHGCLPGRRASIDRLSVRLADLAIANSRAGLAAYGFAEGDRARVVYNGFDPARLNGLRLSSSAPVRGSIVAIMAARMFAEKDWRLLFATARAVADDPGGWRFVAVGDGPDREALMAGAADLVNAGVLEFPRGGLEVMPLIAASGVGVLLTDPRTHAEGCSNAIMEYMACGLPVVCTDSGGNPEIVEDGVTGLLVPPHDVEAVVAALRTLRDEPARAGEMGRAGQQRLRERFAVSRMAADFVAAYEWAIGARNGKQAVPSGEEPPSPTTL
jgi:glycosyltransferase involved in cell wall biosynthesis